jgi:hypothetical protein
MVQSHRNMMTSACRRAAMNQPSPKATLDLTGLPDQAVDAIRTLVETIRQQTAAPGGSARFSSREEWVQAIREWAKSHPAQPTSADWSRESIYDGCGE